MKCLIVLILSTICCNKCDKHFDRVFVSKGSQLMRTKSPKEISHTKEELDLTEVTPRIDQKACNDRHSISVFVLSAAQSSGKYFDRRQVTRNTWVSQFKRLSVSVYFALALNINESVNEELRAEANIYEDILQFPFIDAYYNLTLKTISILRWVNRKCLTSTYILKADDDIIVNSKLLLAKLSQIKTGISGQLIVGDIAIPYIWGPAYILAGNISHSLLKAVDTFSGFVDRVEDVFITGVIAEYAGIPRFNTELIDDIGCTDVCPLFKKAIIYVCKGKDEMEYYWLKWRTTSQVVCENPCYIIVVFIVLLGVVIFGTLFGYKRCRRCGTACWRTIFI